MKLRKYNFDQAVFQDSLFQALKSSQQTRHLITLRAQQIVTEISKDVWVTQLTEKLNQEKQKLRLEEQKYQKLETQFIKMKQKQEKKKKSLVVELRTENQKKLQEYNQQLQIRNSQSQAMQLQIEALSKNIMVLKQQNEEAFLQLEKKQNEIQNILKQNQFKDQTIKSLQSKLSQAEVQFQKLFKNHQEQMQKNFSKNKANVRQIQQLKNQIEALKQIITDFQGKKQQNVLDKMKKDNQQKNIYLEKSLLLEKQIKKINNQKQRLRKQLIQSEQNYNLIKKQIGRFKEKYKKFQQEYNQMKLNNIYAQNQKDLINQKQTKIIKQLDQKYKKLQSQYETIKRAKLTNEIKVKTFIKSNLLTLNILQQQNQIIKKFIYEKVNLLKEFAQSTVMRIVNHISTQLNQHFQQCILEIRKARQQKYLARQQTKLKNQIIQHLDKLLNNEAKSVYDLRSQLRLKKKQQQKLRKKLKSHYQQTDKKLQNFQKKYISILKQQY